MNCGERSRSARRHDQRSVSTQRLGPVGVLSMASSCTDGIGACVEAGRAQRNLQSSIAMGVTKGYICSSNKQMWGISVFRNITKASIAGLAIASALQVVSANAVVAVNTFDPPGHAQGPSIYVAVPASETITTTEATYTGGVVLGFATFFPAISFASAPNVYGTADFGNGLARDLTISINNTFATTELSFALFNGETFAQSYTVTAFDATNNVVATQHFANILANFNSGFALVDLLAPGGISKAVISADGAPTVWDFLIDTVAFNQNITSVVTIPPQPVVPPVAPPVQGHRHGHGKKGETELVEVDFGDDVNDIRGRALLVNAPTTVPEPTTYALILVGLGLLGLARHRRQAARN